jgi:hypothetical protein
VAGKITKIAAMEVAKSLGKHRFWKKIAAGVLTPHKCDPAHNRDLRYRASGSKHMSENAT